MGYVCNEEMDDHTHKHTRTQNPDYRRHGCANNQNTKATSDSHTPMPLVHVPGPVRLRTPGPAEGIISVWRHFRREGGWGPGPGPGAHIHCIFVGICCSGTCSDELGNLEQLLSVTNWPLGLILRRRCYISAPRRS